MDDRLEESDSKIDTDLQIDRNEFRKDQFNLFKHNFLESFDEAGYEKLEHLTLNPKLKKDVVNMVRRLQKAKISLNTLLKDEDKAPIDPFIQKLEEVFKELIGFSKNSSEYSIRNIQLPEYNQKDMELLLGKQHIEDEGQKQNEGEEKKTEDDPLKWLCKSNEEYETKITQLLGAGELLMNEWHEYRRYFFEEEM